MIRQIVINKTQDAISIVNFLRERNASEENINTFLTRRRVCETILQNANLPINDDLTTFVKKLC